MKEAEEVVQRFLFQPLRNNEVLKVPRQKLDRIYAAAIASVNCPGPVWLRDGGCFLKVLPEGVPVANRFRDAGRYTASRPLGGGCQLHEERPLMRISGHEHVVVDLSAQPFPKGHGVLAKPPQQFQQAGQMTLRAPELVPFLAPGVQRLQHPAQRLGTQAAAQFEGPAQETLSFVGSGKDRRQNGPSLSLALD